MRKMFENMALVGICGPDKFHENRKPKDSDDGAGHAE
jgi:hypothetical protein